MDGPKASTAPATSAALCAATKGPTGNPSCASHVFCRMRSWMMNTASRPGRSGTRRATASSTSGWICSISSVTTSQPSASATAASTSVKGAVMVREATGRMAHAASGSSTCTS